MSFALIDAKKADVPVEVACAALNVSVSGFYAWKRRPASARQSNDLLMLAHIRAEFSASNGTYGSPRVHAELNESGLAIGRHRVARLMSENGLKARQRMRFKRTTDSDHGGPVASNVLDQDFTATAPDQKWGVDISYVWTAEGWLYLAIVLDLFSRKIVGWQLSDRMKRGLAMDALRRAINLRRPPSGLIHHSDRGSQYCSDDYLRMLGDHGFVASMSGRGNCYDNAMVETVFKTIKSELIWRTAFTTRDQAGKAIGQYIEGFYNPRRRHSSLGYISPATFEATFCADQKEERIALH
jgi:transposase InsO family protein